MSPRSMMSVHPKLRSRSATVALASASLPERNTLWAPPPTRSGATITAAFTVFSDFTTLAPGRRRWICSARESVLDTSSGGGIPWEVSKGWATSKRTLPSRFPSPASRTTPRDAPPAVALITMFTVRGSLGEGAQADVGMVLAPDPKRRVAIHIGVASRLRGLWVTRAVHHVVAKLAEPRRQGPPHGGRSQDADLHPSRLSCAATIVKRGAAPSTPARRQPSAGAGSQCAGGVHRGGYRGSPTRHRTVR